MVSVFLAESYNDGVHGGGGDRILHEEQSDCFAFFCMSLHTSLYGASAPSILCLNLRPVL